MKKGDEAQFALNAEIALATGQPSNPEHPKDGRTPEKTKQTSDTWKIANQETILQSISEEIWKCEKCQQNL